MKISSKLKPVSFQIYCKLYRFLRLGLKCTSSSREDSPKKKRKVEQEEEGETSDNDNLQDDEELALQLISGFH